MTHTTNTTRIYLCGPMTGLPDYNYPAFNAEAARLRTLGYHVENPAENEHPPMQTWAGYMRKAITQMLTCDALAALPNSVLSRGATLEGLIAEALDIPMCDTSEIDSYSSFNPE